MGWRFWKPKAQQVIDVTPGTEVRMLMGRTNGYRVEAVVIAESWRADYDAATGVGYVTVTFKRAGVAR